MLLYTCKEHRETKKNPRSKRNREISSKVVRLLPSQVEYNTILENLSIGRLNFPKVKREKLSTRFKDQVIESLT